MSFASQFATGQPRIIASHRLVAPSPWRRAALCASRSRFDGESAPVIFRPLPIQFKV